MSYSIKDVVEILLLVNQQSVTMLNDNKLEVICMYCKGLWFINWTKVPGNIITNIYYSLYVCMIYNCMIVTVCMLSFAVCWRSTSSYAGSQSSWILRNWRRESLTRISSVVWNWPRTSSWSWPLTPWIGVWGTMNKMTGCTRYVNV